MQLPGPPLTASRVYPAGQGSRCTTFQPPSSVSTTIQPSPISVTASTSLTATPKPFPGAGQGSWRTASWPASSTAASQPAMAATN